MKAAGSSKSIRMHTRQPLVGENTVLSKRTRSNGGKTRFSGLRTMCSERYSGNDGVDCTFMNEQSIRRSHSRKDGLRTGSPTQGRARNRPPPPSGNPADYFVR